jgi:geranylgeranyl pyrophosphate synthase
MHLTHLYPALEDMLAQVDARVEEAGAADGFAGLAARRVTASRGKRLRPSVLLLAAECAGGATRHSISLAAMVELVHTASLVHDDVLDSAAFRRGDRSANALWGNKTAVLLGDYLLAHSLAIMASEGLEAYLADLMATARRMCVGQMCELRMAGLDTGESEYLDIVRNKTGSLFGFCGRAGAMSAGAPVRAAESLGAFGERFGVAFQLADDILDLLGSDGRSGKPEAGDLRHGRLTLPLIHAARSGGEGVRAQLEAILKGGDLSADSLALAREIAQATRGIEYAWGRVAEWLAAARAEIAELPDGPAKRALIAAAGDGFPLPVMAH